MTSKIIDRIRRLLSLAGNNPSQEEAQAAMLQAQRLMVQHQIDASALEEEQEAEEAHDVDVEILGKKNRFYEQLGVIICENFRCKMYWRGSEVRFIGLESEVAAAKAIYLMARSSFLSNRQAYLIGRKRRERLTRAQQRDIRIQWSSSFVYGLSSAFAAQVEENGWALVLVTPALVQQRHDDTVSGRATNYGKQTVARHDHDAMRDGREKGRRFAEISKNTHKPSVETVKMLGPASM